MSAPLNPAGASRDIRQVIAAVDLGSNSFHMVVARNEHGHLVIIDRLREMVRLAAGLSKKGVIRDEAAERAVACLARFGQRLGGIGTYNVRAVGTNTLRRARNSDRFLELAASALGHPIEVIAGREEARLVYLGVAHSAPAGSGRRLVADIGGGSTEIIVGEGLDPIEMTSQYVGCVGLTREFFDSGQYTAKKLRHARLAVGMELEGVAARMKEIGWSQAIGSSGTIRTAAAVLRNQGWAAEGVTRDGLARLIEHVVQKRTPDKLQLTGLSDERAPVFLGGLVILEGLFEALDLESMRVSDGALREGLLYDLLGRLGNEDARVRSIRGLQVRYQVDKKQAERVEATALDLHRQVAQEWQLDTPIIARLISWAARVHEIGLAIAHPKYHAHGAYLLANAELSGFSRNEQQLLAALVGSHRRKIAAGSLKVLPSPWQKLLPRMLVPLRLAVVLHRSRSPAPLPQLRARAGKKELNLRFPDGYLDEHPLSQADLEMEAGFLRAVDLKLTVA